MKITSTAGADAMGASGGNFTVRANNGLGDEAVVTTTSSPLGKRGFSSGTWLRQKKTGGQSVVRFPLDVSAASIITATYGYGSVGLSVSGQPDTRGVQIDSPTIETSYKKWYESVTAPDPIKRAIEPNPDGSKWTHSALQWDKVKKKWVATARFYAQIQNFELYNYNTTNLNPPSVEWKYRGRGPATLQAEPGPGYYAYAPWNPSQDLKLELDGPDPENLTRSSLTGFPTQGTVGVKVTDKARDGAVAENAFLVNWHLPIENVVSLPYDAALDTIEPQWITPYSHTLNGGLESVFTVYDL